jgi:hypothetical protein
MGQPRRVAIFDFSDPLLAPMVPLAILSVAGGFILLLSAILLITVLVRSQFGDAVVREPLRYALAANIPPCLIGMEACVGAHHLGRQLSALGHDTRLMPAAVCAA